MTSAGVQPGIEPTDDVLCERISGAMPGDHSSLRVVERHSNPYNTTFPTEVVTCELGDGMRFRVFCKHFHSAAGHRDREAIHPFYEIRIYRELLRDIPLTLPGFLGAWTDEATGEGLLVLEYLDDTTRVTKTLNHDQTVERAAIWSASFHRYAAEHLRLWESNFIPQFDLESYGERCRSLIHKFSRDEGGGWGGWIDTLCQKLDDVIATVRQAPVTVIHGEFYPKNIMLHHDRIYPVDWETARLGMGEMDLAMLLEGDWERSFVERCIKSYARSRGDSGLSVVTKRFTAGQLLMDIYWLSLFPEDSADDHGLPRDPWRRQHMRESAQQLGIL